VARFCIHASDAKGRSIPEKGPPRTCAKGHGTDGVIHELVDCPGCGDRVAPDPAEPAAGVPKAAEAARGECTHFRELSGAERSALRLDHRRRWGLCLHEAKPLGAAVCACRGCGPKCVGFETENEKRAVEA
jgi:hypothetical protein